MTDFSKIEAYEFSPKRAGERLKALRSAKMMTMSELARESGVSQTAIARIESGRTDMSLKSARALAIALNVELSELTG